MLPKEGLLAYFGKITYRRYKRILERFNTIDGFWHATPSELQSLAWPQKLLGEYIQWRKEINEEKVHTVLENEQIHCISLHDPSYPTLLRTIYDPPLCLFVKGNIKAINPVAVVGARNHTHYGKQVTEQIATDLSTARVSIVSGLALGIDGIAHRAALAAHGHTIAVLGGGIDAAHIHPRTHVQLAERILACGGGLISEYPPGTKPTTFSFPKRNRIIAGLSLGTLVTEARKKSGALITADVALQEGREVFAVPHPITSEHGVGTNTLLQNGAHLVTHAHDILSVLDLHKPKQCDINTAPPQDPTHMQIWEHLSAEPTHIDHLIRTVALPGQIISSNLVTMELEGYVSHLGGNQYIRS